MQPSETPFAADTPLQSFHSENHDLESFTRTKAKPSPRFVRGFRLRRFFTRNVLCTLLTHSLVAFHISTFNSIVSLFSVLLLA